MNVPIHLYPVENFNYKFFSQTFVHEHIHAVEYAYNAIVLFAPCIVLNSHMHPSKIQLSHLVREAFSHWQLTNQS